MALNLFRKKKPKKTSKPSKKKKKVVKKKLVKKVKRKVKKKVVKKRAMPKKVTRKKIKKKKKKAIKKRPVKRVKKKVVKKPTKIKKRPVKIKQEEINKMDDQKVFDLIQKSRLPLLKTIFIKKDSDLDIIKKIGFPCYMKASGPKIIHKTEIDGVIKVEDEEQAAEAFKTLMKIRQCEKVIVQEAKEGFELILGAKSDQQFGHLVSVGIGGIYTEILKDVSFRICPIEKGDAETMVRELKGYDIFTGARGQESIDLKSLHELIGKLCRFATTNKIKEMDINPLICDKKGCYISDVRIVK